MSRIAGGVMASKFSEPYCHTWCKFMVNQFPECHCTNISSNKIPKMIAICAGEYKSCDIYCQKIENTAVALP